MDQWIDLLFENYGKKISKMMRSMWVLTLSEYSEERIKSGVMRALRERTFLPNLAEFKQILDEPDLDLKKIKRAVNKILTVLQEYSYTHNIQIVDDLIMIRSLINCRASIRFASLRNDISGEYFRYAESKLYSEYIRLIQEGVEIDDKKITINSYCESSSLIHVFLHEDIEPKFSNLPKKPEVKVDLVSYAEFKKIAAAHGWGAQVAAIESKKKEVEIKEEKCIPEYDFSQEGGLIQIHNQIKNLAKLMIP